MKDDELERRLQRGLHDTKTSLVILSAKNQEAGRLLNSVADTAAEFRALSEQSFTEIRGGLPNKRKLETKMRRDLRRSRRALVRYWLKESLRIRVAWIKYCLVQSWRLGSTWLKLRRKGMVCWIMFGGLAWLMLNYYS